MAERSEFAKLLDEIGLDNPRNKARLALEAAFSEESDPVATIAGLDPTKVVARAGTTVARTTAIALIATAKETIAARPIVEVNVSARIGGTLPSDARRDRRVPMLTGLMNMAQMASAIVFDKQKVVDFAYLLSVYGYEAARMDMLILDAVNKGAGRYVQDDWMLEVLDAYRTAKGNASRMLISANAERQIDAGDLEIVPEKPRAEYWAQIKNALEASGFYTLVEQLAYFQRAAGKSKVLESFANVQATLGDSRYDPAEMKRLLEKVLTIISTFMEDRTHVLNGDRVAREHHVVTLSALTDEDVLYFLCKPPRNTKDVAQYFWTTDQVDLTAERAGLRLGETTYQALVALAEYNPNQPFESQIWPMAKAADPLFTHLQELGTMLPRRYGFAPSREEGAKGFFANIFAAINLRVKVGGVEVAVRANAQVAEGAGGVSFTGNNNTVITGGGAYIGGSVTIGNGSFVGGDSVSNDAFMTSVGEVPEDVVGLRNFISRRFNDEELRTLCTDTGVDYENLPGQGKNIKAQELAMWHSRSGSIRTLRLTVASEFKGRNSIPW